MAGIELYKIKKSRAITLRLNEILYLNYGINEPYATRTIAKTSNSFCKSWSHIKNKRRVIPAASIKGKKNVHIYAIG